MQLFSTRKIPYASAAVALGDAQAAAYAAMAYCISTGKPSVFLGFGMAEALQSASAALTAWGDKQPMAIVNVVKQEDFGILRSAYRAVSRTAVEIRRKEDIEKIKFSGPPSLSFPVCAAVSDGIDTRPVIENLLETLSAAFEDQSAGSETCDEAALEKAARLLRNSRKPVILLGRGAAGNIQSISRILEKMQCPLLLTASATTLPDKDLKRMEKLSGSVVIPSGNLVWIRAFYSADLILALGSGLSEVDWFGLKDTKIHRAKVIKVGPESSTPLSEKLCDLSFDMDMENFSRELSGKLVVFQKKRAHAKWVEKLRHLCRRWKEILRHDAANRNGSDGLDPAFVSYEIATRAGQGTIFVSEGGTCGMWLWANLWLQPFVFPVQMATIGVSIPMSIGVKTAHPNSRVWCVLGDGAFFYHAGELKTLAQQRLPAVFFIFNDSSWGAIRLGQTFVYQGKYTGTNLPDTDYASIARACGCEGMTVKRSGQLRDALEYAKKTDAPLVVDIKIKRDAIPLAGLNFVLAEFDGVLKTIAPNLIMSAPSAALRGRIPVSMIKNIARMIV